MALGKLAESNEVIVAIYTCGIYYTYLLLVVDQEDSLWLTLTRSRLNLAEMVTACLKCSVEKTSCHKEMSAYGCGNDWRLVE